MLRRAGARGRARCALVAHPAVIAVLERQPDWLEALARAGRRRGRLARRPALAMSGGHAETSLNAKPCPLCGKPPSAEHAPFCRRGCRDRDLLKWLGDGYRIARPAGRRAGLDGLDSDEGDG